MEIKVCLRPEQVEPFIRPSSAYYMPHTKIIEIENTHNRAGGTIHPMENIKAMKKLADKYNLIMHLDGARIWNASVETKIPVSEYASNFDSISCCLSKGLARRSDLLSAEVRILLKKHSEFVKHGAAECGRLEF